MWKVTRDLSPFGRRRQPDAQPAGLQAGISGVFVNLVPVEIQRPHPPPHSDDGGNSSIRSPRAIPRWKRAVAMGYSSAAKGTLDLATGAFTRTGRI